MANKKNRKEGELVLQFNLKRIAEVQTPEMESWLSAPDAVLSPVEKHIFDRILPLAINNISSWGEEDLKMQFISQVLPLGHVLPSGRYGVFYEKTLSGVVDGIELSTKTDFMVAKGALGVFQNPYFHFQEYKPSKPSGDSMAQLLEAMLIAQELNKNGKPLYGVEIVADIWRFVTLKDRTYCVSKAFSAIDREGLLRIIAILRQFIQILETQLLDNESN